MTMVEARYEEILKRHFEDRCRRNPTYSLRAFARDLHLPPSRLCEVLKGKSGLSQRRAQQLSKRLGLSSSESEYFVALVSARHARNKAHRSIALDKLETLKSSQSFTQLQIDLFQTISDFWHYAILELSYVEDFQSDHAWIARRLGISENQVGAAVERLLRLGLLEVVEGRYRCVQEFVNTSAATPSEFVRKHHHQILDRAHDALERQPIAERDFSSMTMAIDESQLAEAKEKIRAFTEKLSVDLSRAPHKNRVYILSTQFFALDQPGTKE